MKKFTVFMFDREPITINADNVFLDDRGLSFYMKDSDEPISAFSRYDYFLEVK